MCHCYQQQDSGRCHKACIGIFTLGIILPAQLYISGVALREAAYSPTVISFIQGGLGIILFVVGILLLSKSMHHKWSGCESTCEDKCQTSSSSCCK